MTVDDLGRRLDQLIAAGAAEFDNQAAPNASDAEFLRRVSLDLTGVIPSAGEARAFLANPSATKRQQLIDRLLANREVAQTTDTARRDDAQNIRITGRGGEPVKAAGQFQRGGTALQREKFRP